MNRQNNERTNTAVAVHHINLVYVDELSVYNYQPGSYFGAEQVGDEDRDRDEKHASDGDDAKQVPIVIRSLVVLPAKIEVVMT